MGVELGIETGLEDGVAGGGVGVVVCADACSGLAIIKLDAAKTRISTKAKCLLMLLRQ